MFSSGRPFRREPGQRGLCGHTHFLRRRGVDTDADTDTDTDNDADTDNDNDNYNVNNNDNVFFSACDVVGFTQLKKRGPRE